MKIVDSMAAMQRQSAKWVRSGEAVGFVPTMGALHEGHLTLIRRARKECKRVVVSIYVNPTQFGPNEDLAKYPRPREQDLALCRKEGVNLVFAPTNLYLPDHSTYVEETAVSQDREGAIRPGHFRGVATVVLKLFNLVRPTKAYFGQKDAQQVEVIQRMVRDLDVPVKIVVVPTVRDPDGVALSSRNRYLSTEERFTAKGFALILQTAAMREFDPEIWLRAQLMKFPGLKLDYVEKVGDRLVAAVKIGSTRLLDNEKIQPIPRPEALMIQTKSGKNVSTIFTSFYTERLPFGRHLGEYNVAGSPLKTNPEVQALLTRLEPRKKKRDFCSVIVSQHQREYRFKAKKMPELRAKVAMKKRGASYGDLYEGAELIGRIALFEDEK